MNKPLTAALLFLSANALANDDLPDILECRKNAEVIKLNSAPYISYKYDCTLPGLDEEAPYRMNDGSIQLLKTRIPVQCQKTVCNAKEPYKAEEYNGQIASKDSINYTITRGYYLGPAEDGRTVAYRIGTGPNAYGDLAEALPEEDEADIENRQIKECLMLWTSVWYSHQSDKSPITATQEEEWTRYCKNKEHPTGIYQYDYDKYHLESQTSLRNRIEQEEKDEDSRVAVVLEERENEVTECINSRKNDPDVIESLNSPYETQEVPRFLRDECERKVHPEYVLKISLARQGNSAPETNTDACVEQWGQAFRKEEGELAVATVYHLQEWEQLCQDGKRP